MGAIKRFGSVALAGVLSLALVACGGDDDGGDDAATEDTAEQTTEAPSGDGGDVDLGDLGDLSTECAELASAFANAGAAIGSAFTGSPTDDIEEIAAYFREVGERLPDEIADDFQVFGGAYAEFAAALAELDIDFQNPGAMDPDALAQLEEITAAFDSPAVQEAQANIEAYVDEVCPQG